MIDRSAVTLETTVAASPIWVRLRDTFTGRAPAGAISVSAQRSAGGGWVALEHPHRVGPDGDLAFVNLGRTRDPGAVGTFDVRITVAGPGMISEDANGDPVLTATVAAWAPDAPAVPSQPDELRLFPGPAYRFPAGTPLLAGVVVDSNGDPVPRARVWATETVQSTPLTEEVRSDGEGRFRLPLRWSAGATTVNGGLGSLAGSIVVSLPAALSSTHQITLT